ncbi:MAG: tetratricopeptide repeat protein [Planctomycetes bacterium]|nr:tetratricopeptide repeat protein [Planctomycetota bacterium]
MTAARRSARVNVKVLLILIASVALLAVAAIVGSFVRNNVVASNALAAGEAALERRDWAEACKQLRRYLERRPDDLDILEAYAGALMEVRPLDEGSVGKAIGAYRRMFRLDANRTGFYKPLARLYAYTGNFADLAHLARTRLDRERGEPEATLWLVSALVGQRNLKQAQAALIELIEALEQRTSKPSQYIDACLYLSRLGPREDSLGWIDKAVGENSASALLRRAMFHRTEAESALAILSDAARAEHLRKHQEDLERATALGSDDPRLHLALSQEWMQIDETERAGTALAAVEQVDPAALKEYFINPGDWQVLKFLVTAELGLRTGQVARAIALGDEILGAATNPGRQLGILPWTIKLSAAAGDLEAARRQLSDYRDLLEKTRAMPASFEPLAVLEALVAQAAEQPFQVIDKLEPLVGGERSSATVLRLLARAYVETRQDRRAVQTLLQYLRLQPRDERASMQLLREYIRIGDWNTAIQFVDRADQQWAGRIEVELLKREAELRHTTSRPRQQVDDAELARLARLAERLAELREENPQRVEIRVLLAALARFQSDWRTAEDELQRAIQECKKTLPAELMLARLYLQTDRPDEAAATCRAACERNPTDATPWLALVEVLEFVGRLEEARDALVTGRDRMEKELQKRRTSIRLALFDLRHDQRRQGMTLLLKLVEDQDYHADVNTRDLMLSLLGDDPADHPLIEEPVAQGLIDGLKETQGRSGLLWRRHQAALAMRRPDWRAKQREIDELLQYCIDADPGWPEPVLSMGKLYGRLRKSEQTESLYRRTLKINPGAFDVAARLLSLLERQNRFSAAKAVLEEYPNVGPARRAMTYVLTGDWGKAIEQLELKIAGDPKDWRSRLLLARLVYGVNAAEAETAYQYLDEALEVAPDSLPVSVVRAAIKRAENKVEEARAILDEEVARSERARQARDDEKTRRRSFSAYYVRGVFRMGLDEQAPAETDFVRLTELESNGEGHLLLGDYFRETSRPNDGVAAWERGLALHEHPFMKRKLMRALLQRDGDGDRPRAVEMLADLEKVSRSGPQEEVGDPELLWIRAVLTLAEETPEARVKTEHLLTRVVRVEPSFAEAHLGLVQFAMERGDFAEARDRALVAQGQNPGNRRIQLVLAEAEFAFGNRRVALNLVEAAVKRDATDRTACVIFSEFALQMDERQPLEQARTRLEAAIQAHPKDAELVLTYARVLESVGQSDRAVEELEAFRQEHSQEIDGDYRLELAQFLLRNGDPAKSSALIDEVDRLNPGSVNVLRARVVWHAEQDRLDEIATLMEGYEPSDRTEAEIALIAARALASAKSAALIERALQLFELVTVTAPKLTEAHLGLALLSYKTGDTPRAVAIYRDVLKAAPQNTQALNDLAWVLAEARQEYAEALELADRGLLIAPNDIHLLDTRAEILSNLPGRLEDARDDLKKCANLSDGLSSHAKALFRLARVCARLAEHSEAKGYMNQALRIDPGRAQFSEEESRAIDEILRR